MSSPPVRMMRMMRMPKKVSQQQKRASYFDQKALTSSNLPKKNFCKVAGDIFFDKVKT